MDEREASAEGIVCANEGVMEEYRERKRREAELGGTLELQTAELTQQRLALNEMKARAQLARLPLCTRELPRSRHAGALGSTLALQRAALDEMKARAHRARLPLCMRKLPRSRHAGALGGTLALQRAALDRMKARAQLARLPLCHSHVRRLSCRSVELLCSSARTSQGPQHLSHTAAWAACMTGASEARLGSCHDLLALW